MAPRLCVIAMLISAVAGGAAFAESPQRPPAERAIVQALDRPVTLSIDAGRLDETLREIGASSGINIRLDRVGLTCVGIEPDAEVSVDVRDVSLRTALELLFREYNLEWAIRGDVLLVTSEVGAESLLCERWFRVGDLLPRPRSGPARGDALIELITSVAAPSTWHDVGGRGTIELTRRRGDHWLVIRQTDAVHDIVEELLSTVRGARPEHPPSRRKRQERAVVQALDQKVSITLDDGPLDQALRVIESTCSLNVEIDERALTDAGVSADASVTLHANGVSAHEALDRLLKPYDLTWMPHREVLLITSQAEAELMPRACAYDVSDLVQYQRSLMPDYGPLIDLLTARVDPMTWDFVGGQGAILAWESPGIQALLIEQTREVHENVVLLLDLLRSIQADRGQPGRAWRLTTSQEARVDQALDRRVSLFFEATPLADAILEIRDLIGVGIELDGLRQEGIDFELRVHLNAVDLPARFVLQRMLEPIDCIAVARRDSVRITTAADENAGTVCFYDVSDLIAHGRDGANQSQALVDLVMATISPESWNELGGYGEAIPFAGPGIHVLVVTQTVELQAETAKLLASLRRSLPASRRLPRRP